MHTKPYYTQSHTAPTLPRLVSAHIAPDIAIQVSTQTQSVAAARFAVETAHTDWILDIARHIEIWGPVCVGVSAVGIATTCIDDSEKE